MTRKHPPFEACTCTAVAEHIGISEVVGGWKLTEFAAEKNWGGGR